MNCNNCTPLVTTESTQPFSLPISSLHPPPPTPIDYLESIPLPRGPQLPPLPPLPPPPPPPPPLTDDALNFLHTETSIPTEILSKTHSINCIGRISGTEIPDRKMKNCLRCMVLETALDLAAIYWQKGKRYSLECSAKRVVYLRLSNKGVSTKTLADAFKQL